MNRTPRLTALLLLLATALVGCGSSSTSPGEAHAVAVAEHRFLVQYGRAVEAPGQAKARTEFLKSIEALLAGGLGSECAEALKEDRVTLGSVPSFAGGATGICRAESQK